MSDMIEVQPAAGQLRAFARWAVDQDPKVRTASQASFAVPAHLFTHAPEAILIGALVDGRRYVSPDEDGAEPAGYIHPEAEAVPGEPLPELPPEAYGPDSVPLEFAPLDDTPADDSDRSDPAEDTAGEDGFPCGLCDRSLKTARGRDTHRRQAHTEES